jgi:hypothetical protein
MSISQDPACKGWMLIARTRIKIKNFMFLQ